MSTTVATSEVLNRAADLIEERGWIQGPFGMRTVTRELCLEGAVRLASGGQTTSDGALLHYLASAPCPAGNAVIAYLGEGEPWLWNDEPGRTAAEVIEVLRAAAVIEAAREQKMAEVSA
jgi:hypothetical protein